MPRAGFRDTISVLRSGRFVAAIALVAYSIAGSRKRRTLARTSGADCCMLSAINGRYYHVAKPVLVLVLVPLSQR